MTAERRKAPYLLLSIQEIRHTHLITNETHAKHVNYFIFSSYLHVYNHMVCYKLFGNVVYSHSLFQINFNCIFLKKVAVNEFFKLSLWRMKSCYYSC